MSMQDTLFSLYKSVYPGASDDDINTTIDRMKNGGQLALQRSLDLIPGANTVKDIVSNAPALINNLSGGATANGVTANPITSAIPNPGNPVSGLAQGVVLDAAKSFFDPTQPTDSTPAQPVAPKATGAALVDQIASGLPSSTPAQSAPMAPTASPTAPVKSDNVMPVVPTDADKRAALEKGIKDGSATKALAAGLSTAGDVVLAGNGNTPAGLDKTLKNFKSNDEEARKHLEDSFGNDPSSGLSKIAQGAVSRLLKDPATGKSPDLSNMSANQLNASFPIWKEALNNEEQRELKRLQFETLKAQKQALADTKEKDRQQKLEDETRKRYDSAFSARSSGKGAGIEDMKVNSAIHSRSLIEASRDPKTGEVNLNQVTTPELAQSLANLVSGSNSATVEQYRNMTPQSLYADVKSKVGYMFGKPVDVLPKEWVDQLVHQIDRQGTVAEDNRNKYLGDIRMPTDLEQSRKDLLAEELKSKGNSYRDVFGIAHDQQGTKGMNHQGQNVRQTKSGISYTVK